MARKEWWDIHCYRCSRRDTGARWVPSTCLNTRLSTWFLDDVGYTTGAVLPVLKRDFRFAGTLDGNGEAASTSFSGPDAEFGWKDATKPLNDGWHH